MSSGELTGIRKGTRVLRREDTGKTSLELIEYQVGKGLVSPAFKAYGVRGYVDGSRTPLSDLGIPTAKEDGNYGKAAAEKRFDEALRKLGSG